MSPTKPNKQRQKTKPAKLPARLFAPMKQRWQRNLWNKIWMTLAALLIAWTAISYGVARWYIAKHANEPFTVGTTFIPRYARFYGLDPQTTMDAIINDLDIKHFRLVSYWDDIEPNPGEYRWEELDWQFEKVKAVGGEISLAIGLRQPRWPECHMPAWAAAKPKAEWAEDVKTFMGKVIERYGDHPSLKSYQLENEFFMTVFGICPDHSRERLEDEFKFVKEKDPNTPVIISRSNNWIGVPVGQPQPDQFAISVYKRIWDQTVTKRYFEYPLPAWFYASLAGWGELLTGKDMIVHELQAEAWLPTGYDMRTAPLEEQNKSLNAQRLRDRFEYGRATGMRTMYVWGTEWWYYRKVSLNDPSLWQVAQEEVARLQKD